MVKTLRDIDWTHVAANVVVLVLLGVAGLYFSTYQPPPFTEAELASSRAFGLSHCGAGMFDVVPQAPQCQLFDALALQRPCTGPGCEAFELTLHADGNAELDIASPADQAGHYRAGVGRGEFRELANLVGSLRLDRRGSLVSPDGALGADVLRAGCGGTWSLGVTQGGDPGEIEALGRCLLDVKQRADWSLVPPTPPSRK